MNKLAIPFVILLVLTGLAVAAYGNSAANEQKNIPMAQAMATEPMVVQAAGGGIHAEHPGDHMASEAMPMGNTHASAQPMAGTHGVPAEAAAVENPIPASDESIRKGAAIFIQSCAVCHGNTGKGDGLGAAGLNPKPADLHADHVQGNSDGVMFWIISHGREGTAMPPWDTLLNEEQRWDVVNFLRTLGEE